MSELFSGDNSRLDIKAVVSFASIVVALLMYAAYGIKGLLVAWDMPPSIRDVTVGLILGGGAGAAATLWNKKLGVSEPPPPVEPVPGPAMEEPKG